MDKITTFTEYSKRAAETQMESCKNEDYLRFGLISEVGELCAIFKRAIRGDFKLEDKRQDVLLELGDICWYLDRLYAQTHGKGIYRSGRIEDMEIIYKTPNENWIDAFRGAKEFQPSCNLLCEAAFRCVRVDKTVNGVLFYHNRRAIASRQTFMGMFFEVSKLANEFGYTLPDVLTANVEKLAKRKERGLIMGSGDHRGEPDAPFCGCGD